MSNTLSYRKHLARIGIDSKSPVSYRGFASRPSSLRRAILSMEAPGLHDWSQVSSIFRDDYWTDEVQGVAWDGENWIFSTNANQSKPKARDKSLYVFEGGKPLGDGKWKSRLRYENVPHPVPLTIGTVDHWGQLCYHEGFVYVSHWWKGGLKNGVGNVVVFKDADGVLSFDRWVELEKVTGKAGKKHNVEFQAINPWDGLLYTCAGSGVREFFMHDQSGMYTGKSLKLDPRWKALEVQGACFSPNGHLYVADDTRLMGRPDYKAIWCYSALNGRRLGVVRVMAKEDKQELEGVCYADVGFAGGKSAQIHVVLLENEPVALDDFYFKSFSASRPEVV